MPSEPLTVVTVDRPLTADEATKLQEDFRLAAGPDRRFIVTSPGVFVAELEPYAVAARRALLGLVLGLLGFVSGLVAFVIALYALGQVT